MIERMNQVFANCTLGEERTLFEGAFYDFNHLYFEETTNEDLISMGDTIDSLISKWLINPTIYKNYKDIAINALENNKRPDEKIMFWKDVTQQYLCDFCNSLCFLSQKGKKFFFISAIYVYLKEKDTQEDDYYIYDFLEMLEDQSHDFSDLLDKNQKKFIKEFLKTYFPDEKNIYTR